MSRYGVFSVFSRIRAEYGEIRSISPFQAKCGKIRTRKNSVFGHFSGSGAYIHWQCSCKTVQGRLWLNLRLESKMFVENSIKNSFINYRKVFYKEYGSRNFKVQPFEENNHHKIMEILSILGRIAASARKQQ